MSIDYISDNTPSGYQLGRSTTEKIGFYGQTPIVKGAAITSPPSVTNVALSNLLSALDNLGLINDQTT